MTRVYYGQTSIEGLYHTVMTNITGHQHIRPGRNCRRYELAA